MYLWFYAFNFQFQDEHIRLVNINGLPYIACRHISKKLNGLFDGRTTQSITNNDKIDAISSGRRLVSVGNSSVILNTSEIVIFKMAIYIISVVRTVHYSL